MTSTARRSTLLLAIALLLLATACSQLGLGQESSAPPSSAAAPTAAPAPTTAAPAPTVAPTPVPAASPSAAPTATEPAASEPAASEPSATVPAASEPVASEPAATGAATTSARVGETQRHPNGTTLTVQSVATEGTAITVQLQAVNGFTEQIELAGSLDNAVLIDDAGNVYNFVPPPDNQPLRIGPGETLSGSLAFLGPIAPEATSLRLRFNMFADDPPLDIRDELDIVNSPKFDIELPVPQ